MGDIGTPGEIGDIGEKARRYIIDFTYYVEIRIN
jgi:hypothetical protein